MANNPRKFSEKIALLNQKEQEGNAEFEKIMREVSNATSKMPQPSTKHNTNLIAMSPSAFLSRSLPNVNAPIHTNLDNNNEEAAAASALAGLLTTSGYSNDINKSPNERSGSVGPQDKDLIKFPATNARESRGRSVGGGPMRSRSRNIDTSPYSSNNNAYLSPPTDSSWRRTSSDSAIHQSLTQAQDMHNNVSSLMLSPRAQKRISASQSNSMKNLHQQHLHHHHTTNNSGHQTPTQLNQQHSHSQQNMTMLNQQSLMQQTLNQQHLQMNNLQQDMKSRSVSRLPGISIYPSGNDDTLQIPIGNSTGSLPDLTLVHFQSPLSTPLDLEHDHQLTVTSSFNTNPSYSMPMASTNQTTNQLTNMGIYNNLDYSPKHYGTKATSSQGIQLENNSYNQQQQQQQQTAPITIDQQQRHHQQQQQHQQHSPNHQSYPTNQMNEKLMSYRNTASPTNLSSSQGNLSKNSYRSTHNRPSPGSSPGVPGLTTNFDSNSSAPCSPSPQMAGINGQTFDTFPSVDSFYINPNSIQQHFEQFSLDWTSLVQVLVDSGCTISAEVKVDSPLPDYITSTTNDQNYSQMTENNFNGMMDDGSTANRNQQQQQQQQHSPTNRSNNNNSRTNSNNNNNNSNNNNNGHNNNNNSQNSPNNQNHRPNNANNNSNSNNNNNQHHQHHQHQQQHSPMNNDSLIGNNNYNSFNAALELALHENGVNDILLGGGMGSDSNSKLITSSSAALQTSISMMTSHASPQHLISTQTTTSIPEIIFSDYSSGSTDFARDIFCNEFELGSTELQMFENANIIADPTIEDSFRRDLY